MRIIYQLIDKRVYQYQIPRFFVVIFFFQQSESKIRATF